MRRARRATRSVLLVYVRIASPKRNEVMPSAAALSRVVTNCFDIVSVRIEHKRSEVMLVVVGPQSRQAIILAAGLHGRFVEGGHRLAILGDESHVGMGLARLALADPEVGLVVAAEAGALIAAGHLR